VEKPFVPQFGPNGAVMNAPAMSGQVRELYEDAQRDLDVRTRPRREQVAGGKLHKPVFVIWMELGHAVIPITVWAVAAFRLVVRGAFPPSFGDVDWIFEIAFLVQVWLFFVTDGIWTRVLTRRQIAPPPGKTPAPVDVFWLTAVWSSLTWPTVFSVPIVFWTIPEAMRGPYQLETGLFFGLLMLCIEGILRAWVWLKKWYAP